PQLVPLLLLLLTPRPPRPTLSPYTTLFRSSFDLNSGGPSSSTRSCGFVIKAASHTPPLRKVCVSTPTTGLPEASVTANRGLTPADRKSTRLNSSHRTISYAVFCLKKKNRRS